MYKSNIYNKKLYLLALLGRNIQYSMSPFIYENEAKNQNLRCSYQLLDFEFNKWKTDFLPNVLFFLENFGFSGCNITHPFKQIIIPYLDDISKDSKKIGSVNTVIFKNKKKIGYNTDHLGFIKSFNEKLNNVDVSCVALIGAGGVGSAISYSLLKNGCKKIMLYDNDIIKSKNLQYRLKSIFGDKKVFLIKNIKDSLNECSGLIQATPIGMVEFPGMPIDINLIHKNQWVVDVIYNPKETELIKNAKIKGCKVLTGEKMLIYQAAESYKLYTNYEPNIRRMLKFFKTIM